MWARGVSEFDALVMLAFNPITVSVRRKEKYQGFSLSAAIPGAVILIVVVRTVFPFPRLMLSPEAHPPCETGSSSLMEKNKKRNLTARRVNPGSVVAGHDQMDIIKSKEVQVEES